MNYGSLFEGWELSVAKRVIDDYRKEHRCLQREGFDDLLQECLIHWLEVRDRYDPDRGASKKTYMAEVVGNVLGHLAEKSRTDKRKAIYESISLDEPLNDDEDSPTLKDKIANSDDVPPQTNSELKIELTKAYQRLTPQQQKLCKLLGEEGLNINEACKHFGKHRSNVYRDVLRIRQIFEEEGLKDYLK